MTTLPVDDDAHPFFGVDTAEVVALRNLAVKVKEYLEREIDRDQLEEGLVELGLVLIGRYEN